MPAPTARRLHNIWLPAAGAAPQAAGEYTISTRGKTLAEEGFIHCSFEDQLAGTLGRFYADVDEVLIMRIDPERLGSPLVIEDLIGTGQRFPHVYGPIPLAAVVEVTTARPAAMRADPA